MHISALPTVGPTALPRLETTAQQAPLYYSLPQQARPAWVAEDRPREKLVARGLAALTERELLALLLGSGTPAQSAVDLAAALLAQLNGLPGVARAEVAELTRVRGIGQAKAITVVAAFELARRAQQLAPEEVSFTASKQVAAYLNPRMGHLPYEVCHVLFLNQANKLIAELELSRGGVAGTWIDPKRVFKAALNHLASAVILAHNHPSGNLEPSAADLSLTRQLAEAGKLLDIRVLDHLILGPSGYTSLADLGHI